MLHVSITKIGTIDTDDIETVICSIVYERYPQLSDVIKSFHCNIMTWGEDNDKYPSIEYIVYFNRNKDSCLRFEGFSKVMRHMVSHIV